MSNNIARVAVRLGGKNQDDDSVTVDWIVQLRKDRS